MTRRCLVAGLGLMLLGAPAGGETLRLHGSLNGMLGLHTWGSATLDGLQDDATLGDLSDPSFSESAMGGLHLSASYVVPDEWLHLGAWFSYQAGEMQLFANGGQSATHPTGLQLTVDHTVHDVALGLTMRLASRMTRRLWFATVLDLGPSFLLGDGQHLATGFRLFPRLTFDYLPWTLATRKPGRSYQVGFTLSLGLVIEAYAAGAVEYDLPTGGSRSSDFDYRFVQPVVMFGGIFGV